MTRKLLLLLLLFLLVAAPLFAQSPSGTTVTAGTSGSITDGTNAIWTFGAVVSVASDSDCSPSSCGSQVVFNGVAQPGTAATLLLYFNGVMYQENEAGTWFSWNGSQWASLPSGDPRGAPVQTQTGQPTFSDSFSGGSMDSAKWQVNAYTRANYVGAGSTFTSTAANCDYSAGLLRFILNQPTASTSTGCELQSKIAFGYGTYEWSIRASSTSTTSTGAGSAVSGQISTGFIISDSTSRTEIDSPEIEGRTPTTVEFTNWLSGANQGAALIHPAFNPQDGFHLYRFIWAATSVQYYIDNVLVATHTTSIPQASSPGFILISHYGTNSGGFGGTATAGTTRYMFVNSFRYWSPAASSCSAF